MDYIIGGKKVKFEVTDAIGKGGEADVYNYGKYAVKIFKDVNHPDIVNPVLGGVSPEFAKKCTEEKIKEMQTKLLAFPKNMPSRVIKPVDLVYNDAGIIVGYVMEKIIPSFQLAKYSETKFRKNSNITDDDVVRIFFDIHNTLNDIHKVAVVGDFNYLNVLIKDGQAFFIDADSMQFGNFHCQMFTEKFVDPLLCDPSMILTKYHNTNSDWYAFSVMLFQSLLFVHPYGGVYDPKDPKKIVPQHKRPFHKISVFNQDVIYPKKQAQPLDILSKSLKDYFYTIFNDGNREVFPIDFLVGDNWKHGYVIIPVKPVKVEQVFGDVVVTHIFKTGGVILDAGFNKGRITWLYHENGKFFRNNGEFLMDGALSPNLNYRINGDNTIFSMGSRVITLIPGKQPNIKEVDLVGQIPAFDANSSTRVWVAGGILSKDGKLGMDYPEQVGTVISNQSLVWVGENNKGFGFYRAGRITRAFLFNTTRKGINDSCDVPKFGDGQIINVDCKFGDYTYFFVTITERGKEINKCFVYNDNGVIIATAQAENGENVWLGRIFGKAVRKNILLSPMDDGIQVLEIKDGAVKLVKEYKDIDVIDRNSNLEMSVDRLFVINTSEVLELQVR